jgi:hypothetical protein
MHLLKMFCEYCGSATRELVNVPVHLHPNFAFVLRWFLPFTVQTKILFAIPMHSMHPACPVHQTFCDLFILTIGWPVKTANCRTPHFAPFFSLLSCPIASPLLLQPPPSKRPVLKHPQSVSWLHKTNFETRIQENR